MACRRTRPTIPCGNCGTLFLQKNDKLRCCSVACRLSAGAARRRVAVPPAPVVGARWVPLSRGLFALVDECDYDTVEAFTWSTSTCGGGKLYARGTGNVYMHRFLLDAPYGVEVDHVDNDGLNNRRSNLRLATISMNRWNMIDRPGVSRFKGVSMRNGRWRARVSAHNKTYHIGLFKTEEAAARAYDVAVREHHGKFARLNFPLAGEQPANRLAADAMLRHDASSRP